VSHKKVPTFELCVTLSNLNDFLNFCTAGMRMKFATKTHTKLPTSLYPPHYLEKLKIQIFCRYSAYMEENANKLHF